MTETPDGWYPDPLGRAEERYWDGTEWTSQVRTGGTESLDVPFDDRAAAPGAAGGAAVAGASGPTAGTGNVVLAEPMREGLARRLQRDRPAPTLAEAVAAVGGVFGVAGIFMLIADEGGRGRLLGGSVLVIALSYALVLLGPRIARPAGLVGVLVGTIVLASNLFTDLDGRSAELLPALIAGAIWLAMFFGPGLRGAPALMAAVLFAGWVVLIALTGGDQGGRYYDDGVLVGSGASLGSVQRSAVEAGPLTLVYALAAIVVGAMLDSKAWRVLATPFIAVAAVLAVVGLSLTVTDGVDAAGSGVLTAAVGAIIAVVGGAGQRRGSIWIGAALAAAGLSTLVLDLVDGPEGAGALFLVLGAIAVVAAVPMDAALRRRVTAPGEPSAPTEL